MRSRNVVPLHDQMPSPVSAVLFVLTGYLIKFASYAFLTGTVIATLAVAVDLLMTILGFSGPWLQKLFFLLPANGEGSISLTTEDIMWIYGIATLIVWGVFALIRWLLRQIRQTDEQPPASHPLLGMLHRLVNRSIVISLIFGLVLIARLFLGTAAGENTLSFLLEFALLYGVALVSNAAYTLADSLAEFMIHHFMPALRSPTR